MNKQYIIVFGDDMVTLEERVKYKGFDHNTGEYEFYNNVPCHHSGCRYHINHACEVCGRIGAEGWVSITESAMDDRMNSHHVRKDADNKTCLGVHELCQVLRREGSNDTP